MKKVLIQLIGGQTLPNIFSLLSVVPDEVVNIYTEKTKEQHEDIVAWCAKFGKSFGLNLLFREYQPVSLVAGELSANIYAILHAEVEKAAEQGNTLVMLNMTGGTKPMAMWAMNHSMGLEKAYKDKGISIPIFYVDTQKRTFDYFSHPEMRELVQKYEPFSRRLTIQQIAESKQIIKLKRAHSDWDKVYPVALLLQQHFPGIDMQEIKSNKLPEVVQKPLSEQVSEAKGNKHSLAIRRFAEMVGADPNLEKALPLCGLEYRDGDIYYAASLRRKLTDWIEKSQKKGKNNIYIPDWLSNDFGAARNFLVSGWWEVLVAHAYQKKNPGAEVSWSVETTSTAASDKPCAETDVIATDGLSLTCISCKRSKHHGYTQELEQHCTRTERLGGLFNKRIIAVYHRDKDIKNLADALGMQMWTYKDVEAIEKGLPEPQPEKQAETVTAPQTKEPEPQAENKTATLPETAHPAPQPEIPATPPAKSFAARLVKAWAVLCGRDEM